MGLAMPVTPTKETTVKTEWKKASDFAEYAEALGVRTKQIIALKAGGDEPTVVIYTPELDEDDLDPETPLVVAWLGRDDEGILRLLADPRYLEGLNWADIEASIERRLAELGL